MATFTSSEAQNTFGNIIDQSQREIVSVTRRGRVATLIMSPQVLQDYVDAQLALAAKNEGFASEEETLKFLKKID